MIPAAMCIGGRELSEPRCSPDGAHVLFGVRAGGRAALSLVPMANDRRGGAERSLACDPPPAVARGMGGGCTSWCPDGAGFVYAASDGQLWLHGLDGASKQLTRVGAGSSASCPAVSADGSKVAYVVDQALVRVLDMRSGRDRRVSRNSYDFALDPVWHPDSRRLVWTAWSVPHMPWDESMIVGPRGEIAGTPGVQIQQPRFDAAGRLWSVRDDNGWLNVQCEDGRVLDEAAEHAGPAWGPGQRSFAVSPDGERVAYTRNEDGFGRLCVRDVHGSRDVARGVHGQLSWQGNTLVALRSGARTPTQVVAYETSTWERRVLAVGPVAEWDAADLVEPSLVMCRGAGRREVTVRVYAPAGASSAGLICWMHGGPTDQWQVTFMPRISYWVARGWNVLVPDFTGSTGHGRAFQQALRGRWGDADVTDVAAALGGAHRNGLGTPHNTVVMGGSAGGFTALHTVLRYPELVAAATVVYPVTDLAALDAHTHRFEAHYTATLVDPSAYRRRSPLTHARRLRRPVLVLHGDADPVVPVESSTAFVERASAAGADVELHVYEGEGHGFRQPQNQLDELARTEAFLRRVVSHR